MDSTSPNAASLKQLVELAVRAPRRWLIPATLVTALAGVYALVRPATWEASQALVIRNEAATHAEPLGKFAQPDEMKTVQETILELVRSRGVLAAALQEVGPPAQKPAGPGPWPRQEDIEDLRDRLRLVPPKGAEFGKTEVFYLRVRDRDRARAVALVAALCDRLEAGFQELRDAKAASMVAELEQAAELAARDLRQSTERLRDIERQVGSDLAELRILHESTAGESALRRTITEIRNELRHARSAQIASQQLLVLLKQARAEPHRLVAMPQSLLESQPALRRLKEGLVDTQLSTANLLGRTSTEHPLAKVGQAAEQQILQRVHEELEHAIRSVEAELRLQTDRIALLDEQLGAATSRLDKLASLRAPYANQVAETRKRTELWERAQQRLADARAAQATARATNLIARIDSPDTGSRPIGPGRAMIVLAGLVGGLMAGFGLLILSVEPGGWATAPSDSSASSASPAGRAGSNGQTRQTAVPPEGKLSLREALEHLATVRPNSR